MGMFVAAMQLMAAKLVGFAVWFIGAAVSTASNLADVITADMLNGVLDQIIGLLPVVLPVMIGFIALRKGIGFVQSILHSA